MCGRYYLDREALELRDIICEAEAALARSHPNAMMKTGEIFPTDIAPILFLREHGIKAGAMQWGLPRWHAPGVVFNLGVESVMHKELFRRPMEEKRVAVPATGFYEWKDTGGSRKQDKFMFRAENKDVLYLAGFYNSFSSGGEIPECFTILTTDANASVALYHNRMPVLLRPKEVEEWLTGKGFKYMERTPFEVDAKLVGNDKTNFPVDSV